MKLDKYIEKKIKEIPKKDMQEIKDLMADPNFSLEKEYMDGLLMNVTPKIKQKTELLFKY